MGDREDTAESSSVQDLTPEEASRIISSHRKVRYGKQALNPAIQYMAVRQQLDIPSPTTICYRILSVVLSHAELSAIVSRAHVNFVMPLR